MTTTTQLRSWWAPPCEGPYARVGLYGAGAVTVRSSVAPAVEALSACLEAHGYKTRSADTGGYNCREITGGTGWSLHAYGTAIDINWQSNPYGPTLITDMPPAMVAAIKGIRTRNGKQVWRWGGDYSGNRDAMHFEVTCHPNDLATGIDPTTIPQEDDMFTDDDRALLKRLDTRETGRNEQVQAKLDEIIAILGDDNTNRTVQARLKETLIKVRELREAQG